ncbi:glutathione transferase [Aspergillus bombycis]|uniref:Glutathione transferase n=1 Tax=Aspergillus bombycis TaxID=109264 RepID=A0A1F8ABK6_9EURO|nr:glutathione transferase [Aspergillus bombycis]OGM49110.1 glutathione transferase [Aspergillus bombycis]
MDNPGIQTSDLPHSLHLDSLSGVAEDASTLAAAQAQHQHDIQEHVHSAESTDAQSLHPLQTAVGTLDSYSIQQQEEQNEAQPFREPFNNLPPRDNSHSLHMQPQCNTFSEASIFSPKQGGYLRDMPSVVDPPDLDLWRERLFNVDETIVLSEEQFLTYFPHVDNIYSHRSTQHYKRKPLISHYWDCRLKGRPPGTPKSDDPNKKKRKRTARQRDLCDVKIKITEYFPGYSPMMIAEGAANDAGAALGAESLSSGEAVFPPPEDREPRDRQPFGVLTPNPPLPEGHPGANGQRFFTIQRVNGNGANGKNDGVSGGHRHTLEESDRVKKNSVQRYLLKEAREKKKAHSFYPRSLIQPAQKVRTMSTQNQPPQKTYHTKATGLAAATVLNRSSVNELKLYGSCFCPFVQRVWIALEAKGIPYQYIEIDPYKKPQSLLEVNPRGLVPALRHGDWGSRDIDTFMQLEDLNTGPPLLPPGDAKLRAHCRLWADFINRKIVPNFYRVLQEQDEQKQISNAQELKDAFATLVNAADTQGPFFLGANMSFVDVQVAPWIIRLNRVLKPYRGWPDPDAGSRWGAWVNAIEVNEHVKATTSDDELYFDSYERYAQNRPNTSLLANAINSGRSLP